VPDAKARAVAAFLLDAADSLNVKVGTDGISVITVSTSRVPVATVTALERELVKNKRAVIALIESENAARTGATS
jgi:hypothetical protein